MCRVEIHYVDSWPWKQLQSIVMKMHNSRFCILFSIITGSHATSVSWFLMRPVFVYYVEHWFALSKCAASSPMCVRLCRYLINYCNDVYFFGLQFTSVNSQIGLCLETGWWHHKSITPYSPHPPRISVKNFWTFLAPCSKPGQLSAGCQGFTLFKGRDFSLFSTMSRAHSTPYPIGTQ